MLSSRLSARSCSARSAASASWRCFANRASSVKTIVPPTEMFIPSIRLMNHSGSGDWNPSTDPRCPSRAKTPRGTRRTSGSRHGRHRRPARPAGPGCPRSRRRPSRGSRRAGSSTASVRARWRRAGSAAGGRSRRSAQRWRSMPGRSPKYSNAIRPTGPPKVRYSTAQVAEIGRISTAMRTSRALRRRVSSSSPGWAPTSANRPTVASMRARNDLTIAAYTAAAVSLPPVRPGIGTEAGPAV